MPILLPSTFLKWWISLALSLGTLAVALNATSLNVAIPTMMASFGASLDKIQWVLTAYTITQTVLIPSVGWLGSRIGDRNLFLLSTALFTGGSLLCSISWNTESLIVARILQAIGAGPMTGVAMSLMYEAFPPHERGLAMGLFMAGWSIGPFFGPLLGGYLTEHVHWRAIFYLNIPVGILTIAAGYLILPQRGTKERPARFDLLGFLTLAGGVVALLLALTQGQELGWGNQLIVTLFGLSLTLLSFFVVVELRSKSPFIELRHFRSFNFSLANLIMFFRVAGFRGANFLISLFLQRGLNYTPFQAGIFLLPGAIITGVVSPLAGIVADRLNPRVPLIAGLLILVFALYGLSTVTLWTTMATIFLLISLKSAGQSFMNAPLNTVALSAVPEGRARMASGIIGMIRGLGDAFGIATLSFLLQRYTFLNLASLVPVDGLGLSATVRDGTLSQIRSLLVRAGERSGGLQDKSMSLLGHSLLDEAANRAYQDLFLLIGCMYGALILLVFLLRLGKKKDAIDLR